MVGPGALFNHLKTTSDLIHTGFFNITELENMMPFEKDAYIQMHNSYMEEANKSAANNIGNSISRMLK